MNTKASRPEATLREVAHTLGIPMKGNLDRWLRIVALEIQAVVTWSLANMDGKLRSAKSPWGGLDIEASWFAQASPQFKFWHLLALMVAVAVAAPLMLLPRAPIFLGAICAFNALAGTVLVVKARNL
jgi:hypothetical protein